MICIKKIMPLICTLLCCWIFSDMRVESVKPENQITLEIEDDFVNTTYKDAVYGEWKIIDYIGSAMANPGISSVMPKEHGRYKELGTVIYIEEDYFKYGQDEKEEMVLFCNILPLSYASEQICFLPSGRSMKELGVEGDYFIYLYIEGTDEDVEIILKDKNHMILSYMQELYLCERMNKPEKIEIGSFMEVSIVDCQTSYCSLYGHEWKIVGSIPCQDDEKHYEVEKSRTKGEEVEFSYGSDGGIWITECNGNRARINARISFINNEYEKGEILGYGTFDELGLKGDFITYISFDTEGTDVEWLKGMFIISEDKILIHGTGVLYECERISEKLKPEDIRLF